MFKDRIQAANELAQELEKFKNKEVVVLAIPRGGLPLGGIIAKKINAPLDVALSKKIGHPNNKELAIGAVSMDGFSISNTDVSEDYIREEISNIRTLLENRHQQYYKNIKPHKLEDQWVIIIDDGIATGNTILGIVELVAGQKPAGIAIASPVAPPATVHKLESSPHVDEVICLHTPHNFRAVGQFYEDFDAVSDKEAIDILEEINR